MLRADLAVNAGDLAVEVAFEVAAGECLALLGPSGAGKTTVLRAIAGLLAPSSGRVECGDRVWFDSGGGVDVPPERRRCGFVFQDYALFDFTAAWRNVAFGITGENRESRARELLERFGAGAVADRRPRELSGGERQRVALARALAPQPKVLLLDEPLSALDPRTRSAAARELGRVLTEAGVPAVLVTHDFAEAAVLSDAIAVIDAGRLVQRGRAADLAAAPASSFVAGLTGAVVLMGTAHREGELTLVALEGGGELTSTDRAEGAVAATVFPWEVALEPAGTAAVDSARNRLTAEVTSLTPLGNRVRVGLAAGQPLTAEITVDAARELALAPGSKVVAAWKATATRLVER